MSSDPNPFFDHARRELLLLAELVGEAATHLREAEDNANPAVRDNWLDDLSVTLGDLRGRVARLEDALTRAQDLTQTPTAKP